MSDYLIERLELQKISSYTGVPQMAGLILDANENALPMPEKVRQEVGVSIQICAFNRYPQIDAADLRKLLAESLGFAGQNVQIGNGSSELLAAACYAFGGPGRKIGYIYPSFSMYQVYIELSGSVGAAFNLEADFTLDYQKLATFLQHEKPAVFIICNPNNPTGTPYDQEKLLEIIRQYECLFVLDEAYMEFSDASLLGKLKELPNAVIMKTFSKYYGLAAARVGYLVAGNPKISEVIGKALLPYHVNAFSLLLAKIVYENRGLYVELGQELIAQREKLAQELIALGVKVYPSQTNFLFLQAETITKTKQLSDFLAENKIFIRDFTKNPALAGLRITIGTREENEKLLAVMQQFFS